MKIYPSKSWFLIAFMSIGLSLSGPCLAGSRDLFGGRKHSETLSAPSLITENYYGRDLLVYVPPNLPVKGARALVIVLHGGLGNASRIESGVSENGLKMDEVADTNGFIVAYLNGTPVTRIFGADKLGWNAGGGCCGVPAENDVNDVGYITGAVNHLVGKYDVDPKRVFGMGHSNGGMMTVRLMCETGLYAAAISVSGPLNLKVGSCPAARGKNILAIHGSEDQNVPLAGGQGTKGLSKAVFNSEEYTRKIFAASGADFHLLIVQGADHKLANINNRIEKTEGVLLAQKAARFIGLAK